MVRPRHRHPQISQTRDPQIRISRKFLTDVSRASFSMFLFYLSLVPFRRIKEKTTCHIRTLIITVIRTTDLSTADLSQMAEYQTAMSRIPLTVLQPQMPQFDPGNPLLCLFFIVFLFLFRPDHDDHEPMTSTRPTEPHYLWPTHCRQP